MTKINSNKFEINTETVPLCGIHLEVDGGIVDGQLKRINYGPANIDGLGRFTVTDRFINSFAGLFGISANTFRYVEPDWLFARVASKLGKHDVQISYDHNMNLLAMTSHGKKVLPMEQFHQILSDTKSLGYNYDNGVVRIFYDVDHNGGMIIGGEEYKKQFTLRIPMDGFGEANSSLALLRQICENGMHFHSNVLSTKIALGTKDELVNPIINYVQNFNAKESFTALRNRLLVAITSNASLKEYGKLLDALELGEYGRGNSGISRSFEERNEIWKMDTAIKAGLETIANNPQKKYGIASLEAMPDKQAAKIKIDCKVHDLLQFATEISTHNYGSDALMFRRRKLEPFITDYVLHQYDHEVVSEGAAEAFNDMDTADAYDESVSNTVLGGRAFFMNRN